MAEPEPIFDGTIRHFSRKSGGILVDDFQGDVVRFYFISHAHTDHYNGLRELQEELSNSNNNSVIYCTEETGELILSHDVFDFEILGPKFEYKSPGDSFTIRHHGRDSDTRVTFVEANHIPGSVMILFEDDRYKALYTGDLRFESYERNDVITDMTRFLQDTTGIDFLYLDVQFLDLMRERDGDENLFPGRRVVLNELVDFVRYETEEERRYDNVHVDCSILGWQEVAAHLAWEFESAVGISDQDYKKEVHECIFGLLNDDLAYSTPDQSFVHVFSGPDCEYCTDTTLRIKPSVIWMFFAESGYSFDHPESWIQEKDPEHDQGFYNCLFSFHSSDYELNQFVRLINFSRGAKIFPINRPFGDTVEEMNDEEITKQVERKFRSFLRDYTSSPSKRMRRY